MNISTGPQNADGAVEIVTAESRLGAAVESALKQSRVAIDLESNGFYHYPERVCLVQLAASEDIYLLDTIALDEVTPLGELLADDNVEKVFHSADYDIRSLDRDWRFRVRNLFDTSIAAAFVGSEKLGLAAVLKEYLNVDVIKDKRLQRANWTRRPISRELVQYAAEDVRHLDRLREVLYQKLDDLGRVEWAREEFDRLTRVSHVPQDMEWGFLSVKGNRTLDGRGLAVLRSLHSFREKEALRRNLPPFKVLSDAVIVALAEDPSSDPAQVTGIGRYRNGSTSSRLGRAIRDGQNAPLFERPRNRPQGGRRLSPGEWVKARERLRLLKGWRAEQADRLKLDGALLWPAASLERLSRRQDGLEEELENDEVRRWQRGELGESLREFLEGLIRSERRP